MLAASFREQALAGAPSPALHELLRRRLDGARDVQASGLPPVTPSTSPFT